MNICGNGVCVCQGGSDVIGEDSSCEDSRRDIFGEARERMKSWHPRYYFDREVGVVLCVQPHEMKRWIKYYYDPELTEKVE